MNQMVSVEVECLILSDDQNSITLFLNNVLKIEYNIYEVIDAKNSVKYKINIVREFKIDKFYHCYLFLINLNDPKSIDDLITSTFPKIIDSTKRFSFDYVMLLIANSYNSKSHKAEKVIPTIIQKANEFSRLNGLFYIDIDFNKQNNHDIINKVLKVRLNQSFNQYTEFYIDTQHHLSKILDLDIIERDSIKKLTLSSIESLTPPQLPERDQDREFFSFEENPFIDNSQLVKKIVSVVSKLLLKLKISLGKQTVIVPVNSNDNGATLANKIDLSFNIKLMSHQIKSLSKYLTQELNKLISIVTKDNKMESYSSIINLKEITFISPKTNKSSFKTTVWLNEERLIFYSHNKEEIDFIVDELASLLNLTDKSVLHNHVESSFTKDKLGRRLNIDYKALSKPLFCVNIDIGNDQTGKILVKENDDLTKKTNEFIMFHGLNEKTHNKILNLLKRLYKETIIKKDNK